MTESLLRRRVAPRVPLEIHVPETENGVEFHHTFDLAFDFNAVAAVSEITGEECLNSIQMWVLMDARMLRAVLWAALLRHQPELDTRDVRGRRTDEGLQVVGSWISFDSWARIHGALWEAYLKFLPKEQAEFYRKARENAEKKLRESAESPLAKTSSPAKSESAANSDGANSGPSPDTTSECPTAKSAS